VSLGACPLTGVVTHVADVGRHNVIDLQIGETQVRAIAEGKVPPIGQSVNVDFRPDKTMVYRDGHIVSRATGDIG